MKPFTKKVAVSGPSNSKRSRLHCWICSQSFRNSGEGSSSGSLGSGFWTSVELADYIHCVLGLLLKFWQLLRSSCSQKRAKVSTKSPSLFGHAKLSPKRWFRFVKSWLKLELRKLQLQNKTIKLGFIWSLVNYKQSNVEIYLLIKTLS